MKVITRIQKTEYGAVYRVRLFIDGVYQSGSDFTSTDYEEAFNKAYEMIQTVKIFNHFKYNHNNLSNIHIFVD